LVENWFLQAGHNSRPGLSRVNAAAVIIILISEPSASNGHKINQLSLFLSKLSPGTPIGCNALSKNL